MAPLRDNYHGYKPVRGTKPLTNKIEPLDIAMHRINKKEVNIDFTTSGQSRANGPVTNKIESLPWVSPSKHSDLARLFDTRKENSIPSISVTTGKASK